MSSSIRALTKHTRTISRSLHTRTPSSSTRAFHTPFAVLSSSSPLEKAPPPSSNVSSSLYEKQQDHSLEPTGQKRTYYVVSEPDPAHTPYEVPSGAYPTSAPYQNYPATEAPVHNTRSSTSSSSAHPTLTSAAPQNESGVKESASVRFREAQGEMGERGGSYGGLGLMDEATTSKGQGELASRNPQPDQPDVAEKNSKLGIKNAWKERK
ncbi:hypothetical protein EIP91_007851 [Steccherinum ochraceum]|uniref:Uncharacterized protein n=1 Tax=Steccherinum ochraceum TaxID=92696 RepID=A0A4R0R3S5_9APHY|nr:hypothetical protein EIP91_007851 [Steccherinum ochraceum]